MSTNQTTSLPATTDVLVVGGGIIGTTLALALRERGQRVVLVDRARLGSGSTSRNAGGVRHQFYQDANIQAAISTIEFLKGFQAEHGVDIGFRQVGYLLMFCTEGQRARLQEGVDRQNALGVDTRMVSVEEIGELAPDVDRTGLTGACYGRNDGYFDPPSLAEGLRSAVLRAGVAVVEGDEVVGVETNGDQVEAVVTRSGRIAVGSVVNAAGAWAPSLAALYGRSLPIAPRRSQVFVMEGGASVLSPDLPHTFDTQSRFYVRRNGPAVWSGAAFKPFLDQAPETQELVPDWTEADLLARRVGTRFPALAGRSFNRAWAGIIEVTADDNPIIGFEHLENMYVAAGFSGHGMCVGPGLADSMAAELCGDTPTIALDGFRLGRFDEGVRKGEGLWLKERPSRFEEWAAEPEPAVALGATS
jgi:sarcosine oxidase subunit beta